MCESKCVCVFVGVCVSVRLRVCVCLCLISRLCVSGSAYVHGCLFVYV